MNKVNALARQIDDMLQRCLVKYGKRHISDSWCMLQRVQTRGCEEPCQVLVKCSLLQIDGVGTIHRHRH